MEIKTFQSAQAPLRRRYQEDSRAAFLTLKARGKADDATVTCKVETGRGLATAGIHPMAGGSGLELCSGDMQLEALVACAGVSLKAAAAMLDIPLKSAMVSAEGDIDLRGTLGVSDDVPVGFKEIRLHFDVDTDAPQETVAQNGTTDKRATSVMNTVSASAPIPKSLNTQQLNPSVVENYEAKMNSDKRDSNLTMAVMPTSRQILLIEDNPDMVDQFRRALQRESFDIFTASIPLEAEAMASGLRPLLIVMDADFSKGASWDILGRLQETARGREHICRDWM